MTNSKFKIRKNGFTIIEILVTITIILILVGGSYSGYATIADRQKLVTAGQNMKNILRDVQSRAYNREIDCTVCNCSLDAGDISHGWVVDFSNKVFYGNCYYSPPDPTPYTETGFGLGSDISLTVSPEIWVVTFSADPPGVDEDVTVCLSKQGMAGNYYKINISRSGEITDSGGLTETCP